MNEFEIHNLLEQFIAGQQEALAAITVAIAQVIGKEALAEQLRLQLIAAPSDRGTTSRVRDALIGAAWRSIRPPTPRA